MSWLRFSLSKFSLLRFLWLSCTLSRFLRSRYSYSRGYYSRVPDTSECDLGFGQNITQLSDAIYGRPRFTFDAKWRIVYCPMYCNVLKCVTTFLFSTGNAIEKKSVFGKVKIEENTLVWLLEIVDDVLRFRRRVTSDQHEVFFSTQMSLAMYKSTIPCLKIAWCLSLT